MMSASPTSRPPTVDDLLTLEEQTGRRFEIVNGEFVEVDVSLRSTQTNARFAHQLVEYVRLSPVGIVVDSELAFELPKSTRRADVAVILNERVPADDISAFAGAPDVVVEVISPSDRSSETRRKVQEWLDAGARLVWVAQPESGEVTSYRRGQVPIVRTLDGTLSGEDVLPGFEAPVRAFFPYLADPA